jgi:hypothetical protein
MNRLNRGDLEGILASQSKFLYCQTHELLFRNNPSPVSKKTIIDYDAIGYVKKEIISESKQVTYCKCKYKGICEYDWF